MGLLSPETGRLCLPTLPPLQNPRLGEGGQERKPFLSLLTLSPLPSSSTRPSPTSEARRSLSWRPMWLEVSIVPKELTRYCQEPFREPTVGHVLCPELRGGVSVGIEGSGWDKDWGVCCCQTRLVGRGFGSACAWAELEWHLRWSQVLEAGKQDAVCCMWGRRRGTRKGTMGHCVLWTHCHSWTLGFPFLSVTLPLGFTNIKICGR